MTVGMAAALSAAFAVAAFLLFRRNRARRKKLWFAAGIVASCLCLVGLVYMAAALLLVSAG